MTHRSIFADKLADAVHETRDELIDLTRQLVAFDTTARDAGDPPRDEDALQRLLKARLEAIGAETDLWQPDSTGGGNRHVPDNLEFDGRPQLAARLRGHGSGRSLLLLGHIDAVSAEPVDAWTSDPFRLELRDGRLYGRGAVDMKGGIASMMVALETLHHLGVELDGDVVWCTVTDEESSGAGGFAAVTRSVRADAGLCAEPTNFDAWVACRGSLTPIITVEGRAGHAELAQPHWREGGAVNAIEKTAIVLDAVRTLREEWRGRADQLHPYLSPGDIVPTMLQAGEWEVTYPARARLVCEVTYQPSQVDLDGTGKSVEREVHDWIERAAVSDPWLAEHPLQWFWDCDVVPAEIPADHSIVLATLECAREAGRQGARVAGFDSWHDGATFIRHGHTPTVCCGPGATAAAHTIDEFVPVDDLVDHVLATALLLVRWCGLA